MKNKLTTLVLSRALSVSAGLLLALSGSQAANTNVIFFDTFDDGAGGLATRNDDPAQMTDIQWRPRIGSQASSYSVQNDGVLGPALRFSNTGNSLWIIGQFDDNAADGVTFGGSSVPASLGPDTGDSLVLSMRIRMSATVASGNFLRIGMTYLPAGPLSADPGSDNSWSNPALGYYMAIPYLTPGPVMTAKQIGGTATPYTLGTTALSLTNGLPDVNAAIGSDTDAHLVTLQIIRLSSASIQIDSYLDGVLVSSALDTDAPYTQFNSVMVLYNKVANYFFDDVQLQSLTATTLVQNPVAVADSYTLLKNTTLTVNAPGLLANDISPLELPLTAAKVTDPAHGMVTSFNSDGSFVYTPNPGYVGIDSFTYKVNDGQHDSIATTVTINMYGVTTWSGAGTANWTDASSWVGADLPGGQNVVFNAASTGNLTHSLGQNWSITDLSVVNPAGPITILGDGGFVLTNSGKLNLSSATANLSLLADYTTDAATPNPAIEVAAGRTLTLSNVLVRLNGVRGPGTVRVTGVSRGIVDQSNGATLIVDGAYIYDTPPVRLTAAAGDITQCIVTNEALLQITNGNAVKINIGNSASVTGTNIFTMQSGTLQISASTGTGANGIHVAPANSWGIFNMNGGTVILSNKQTAIGNITTETSVRVPATAAGNAIVNLNGGVLITPMVDSVASVTGSGAFYFNGGVMQANRDNNRWMQDLPGAYIKAGGAILDSSTNDVTIAQPLQADFNSPGGGLTKRGAGTLRLTGNNSYTGPTIVQAGTLTVSSTAASYPSSSSLSVSNGATISVDVSSGYPVLIPSMTLDNASITLNYGAAPNSMLPGITDSSWTGIPISAKGTIRINIVSTGFSAGDIPLIQYSGTLGGTWVLGTLPAGMSGELVNDTSAKVLILRLNRVPKLLSWYGDKSANWDTATMNWTLDFNPGSAIYTEAGGVGDNVSFYDDLDSGALRTNVNLTATLRPVGMLVYNFGYDYIFSGPGKLSGPMTLQKSGPAAMSLLTANDYSGGTFLTNGSVLAGNDLAFGAGPVTLIGGLLSSDSAATRKMTNAFTVTGTYTFGDGIHTGPLELAGPFSFNNGTRTLGLTNDVIISGGIAGTGGFEHKYGPGSLIFKGFTGGISGGNMQVEEGGMIFDGCDFTRSGSGIRVMSLMPNGRAFMNILSGAMVTLSGNSLNLRIGSLGPDSDLTATNVVNISGTYIVSTNNTSGGVQIGGSCAKAELNLNAGGFMRIGMFTPQAPNNSEVNFDGGTLAGATSRADFMQGLGAVYIRNGGLTVNTEGHTSQPLSLTIAQPLLAGGAGGVTKTGQGTLVLSGTNTYTGPTVVNAGVLIMTSARLSSGPISVADGAVLSLMAIGAGGNVQASSSAFGASTLSIAYSGQTGNPSVAAIVAGNLALNGNLTINVTQLSGAQLGKVPLISYATLTGSGTVAAGVLPSGLGGYVTNNTSTKTVELVVTSLPENPPGSVVVFEDTFEPDGFIAASRNDDAGQGFGPDIQWRPRTTNNSQAGQMSVTADPLLGNAFQWAPTAQFYIIGQFDADASDGVTFGGGAAASMGENEGDKLLLSVDVRTPVALTASNPFRLGLGFDPDGPLAADQAANTWYDDGRGYFVNVPQVTEGYVPLIKETGDSATSPLGGADTQQLPDLVNIKQALLGGDTDKHTLKFELTRKGAGVQVALFWDGALLSVGTDATSPYTTFNSLAMQAGGTGTYLMDNIRLIKMNAPAYAASFAASTPADMTVQFTNTSTGPFTDCTWHFGDGEVLSTTAGVVTHNYASDGTYNVTLIIKGTSGTSITSQPVVLAASTPPVIGGIHSEAGDLVLSGSGGPAGGTESYYLLSSSDLAAPLASWTRVATNVFNADGTFSARLPVEQGEPQKFYILQME